MPPKKKTASLAALVSSSSDEEEEVQEQVPVKKKTAAKKSSEKSTAKATKAPAKRGRGAKAAEPEPEEEDVDMDDAGEEQDDEEESVEEVAPSKKGGKATKAAPKSKSSTAKGKLKKDPTPEEVEQEEEEEEQQEDEAEPAPPRKAARSAKKPSAKTKKGSKQVNMEIPETQQTPKHEDDTPSSENEEADDLSEGTPVVPKKGRATASSTAASTSKKDDVSVSELDLKFSKLQADYKDLSQTRLTAPEKALEAYKKNSEARLKAAEATIASLKSMLEDQTTLPGEIRSLQKALKKRDEDIASYKRKIEEMSAQLEHVQVENTVLQSKLASRASVPAAGPTVPGSAKKPGPIGKNGVGAAGGDDKWVQQAKEDFYGDLSGLTVLGVRREVYEDTGEMSRIFECLQQGTDKTFHFRLVVPENSQAVVTFVPLLQEPRDAKLIDVLPEYLHEEIEFEPSSLTVFFHKILTIMTKKDH